MHDEHLNMILSLKKLNPKDSDFFAPRGRLTNMIMKEESPINYLRGHRIQNITFRVSFVTSSTTPAVAPLLLSSTSVIPTDTRSRRSSSLPPKVRPRFYRVLVLKSFSDVN